MISLPQVHGDPPGEGCGTCTACCDVIGVDSVGKPYYARCPHLDRDHPGGGGGGGGACTIYADRPHTCREYRCLWHLGMLVHGVFVKNEKGYFWGPRSMTPQPRDLFDFIGMMKYFLYLGPRPKFDRFTYWE